MSLNPSEVIRICSEKLASMKARFQVKEQAYYPFPGCYEPVLFFSGSKHELKQVMQVCAYRASSSGLQVTVSVFSIFLQTLNIPWLSAIVSDLNSQSECGYFLFETVPEKMQLRFILPLFLDRRKLTSEDYIKEALWKTIKEADERFKKAGSRLWEEMKQEGAKGNIAEDQRMKQYHGIVAALTMSNLKFTLKSHGPHALQFSFPLNISTLSERFSVCQTSLTVSNTFLTLQSVFCLDSTPAPLPPTQEDALYELVNLINVKMKVSTLLVTAIGVELALKMYCGGANVESTLKIIVHFFRGQLETVFPKIEELLSGRRAEDSASDCSVMPCWYSSNSVVKVSSKDMSAEQLTAEEREKKCLEKMQDVYKYIFYEGLEKQGNQVNIYIPDCFTGLHEFVKSNCCLSRNLAEQLAIMLKTLTANKVQYKDLFSLVYFTEEYFTMPVTLIPEALSAKRINLPNYMYIDMLKMLSARTLTFLQFLTVEMDDERLRRLLQHKDGNLIDSRKMRCLVAGCDHNETEWWRNGHKIGRRLVRMTAIFHRGRLKDLLQISAEYFRSLKYYHSEFQSRAFGLTITNSNVVLLVEEAPTHASLRDFFNPTNHHQAAPHQETVFSRLRSAVDFLHSRGQAQLLLSPASVGLDITYSASREVTDVRPKLPAIPLLSAENSRDVIAYYVPPNTEDDWAAADNASLQALREFIVSGNEPCGKNKKSWAYTDLAALKGTDRLDKALKNIL